MADASRTGPHGYSHGWVKWAPEPGVKHVSIEAAGTGGTSAGKFTRTKKAADLHLVGDTWHVKGAASGEKLGEIRPSADRPGHWHADEVDDVHGTASPVYHGDDFMAAVSAVLGKPGYGHSYYRVERPTGVSPQFVPGRSAGMTDTWTARWAQSWASGAQRFNMTHAPAGSATGGQFATSGGSGAAKAPAKTAPKPAAHPAAQVIKERKAALHSRAAADRAQARKLTAELHILQSQEATAHAAAVKAADAAKKAHHAATAKPVSAKVAAARRAAAAHRKARGHHTTLRQRISGMQQRIVTLNAQAKQLDAQAAAL